MGGFKTVWVILLAAAFLIGINIDHLSLSMIFVIALVALALIAVVLSVCIVPQGMQYTVLRLGRFSKTLEPGLHIIIPIFEQIGHRMNMKEQVFDVPRQEVITSDNAMITVDGVVFYQVMDAGRAAYEVDNLEYAILNLTMTNLRTVMGSMTLDELLSQRDKINLHLLGVIDEATDAWGVKVTRVEIKDISPPQELVQAMAQQMKAERLKRAQILEAEGKRQSDILHAEGEKQAVVLAAEGQREAAFREAEGRERLAEAEAKATNMVSEAIRQGDLHAIQYFVAQRYVEALAQFADSDNQKVFFMPVEAGGVISSIAAIAELMQKQSAD